MKFNERDILENAGKIAMEVAQELALRQYEIGGGAQYIAPVHRRRRWFGSAIAPSFQSFSSSFYRGAIHCALSAHGTPLAKK